MKNLDIIERALGVRLFLKALLAVSSEQKQATSGEELLLRAADLLEIALEANPNDLFLCGLMADICHGLSTLMQQSLESYEEGELESKRKTISFFTEKAESNYKKCADTDRGSVHAQRKYGMFLRKTEKVDECENRLLLTLELCQRQRLEPEKEVLEELIGLLERKSKPELAAQLRQRFEPEGKRAEGEEEEEEERDGKLERVVLKVKGISSFFKKRPEKEKADSDEEDDVFQDDVLMEGLFRCLVLLCLFFCDDFAKDIY